mmetsp:Transcript_17534/g.49320  ORF Transcript_17534/g.49320 Transcript_17534/m.49320 type:complete len:484 (-) Transcript_17534:4111-5562(-)
MALQSTLNGVEPLPSRSVGSSDRPTAPLSGYSDRGMLLVSRCRYSVAIFTCREGTRRKRRNRSNSASLTSFSSRAFATEFSHAEVRSAGGAAGSAQYSFQSTRWKYWAAAKSEMSTGPAFSMKGTRLLARYSVFRMRSACSSERASSPIRPFTMRSELEDTLTDIPGRTARSVATSSTVSRPTASGATRLSRVPHKRSSSALGRPRKSRMSWMTATRTDVGHSHSRRCFCRISHARGQTSNMRRRSTVRWMAADRTARRSTTPVSPATTAAMAPGLLPGSTTRMQLVTMRCRTRSSVRARTSRDRRNRNGDLGSSEPRDMMRTCSMMGPGRACRFGRSGSTVRKSGRISSPREICGSFPNRKANRPRRGTGWSRHRISSMRRSRRPASALCGNLRRSWMIGSSRTLRLSSSSARSPRVMISVVVGFRGRVLRGPGNAFVLESRRKGTSRSCRKRDKNDHTMRTCTADWLQSSSRFTIFAYALK